MTTREFTYILGVKVDRIDTKALFEKVEEFVKSKTPHHIAYVNVDCINKSRGDPEYKDILESADLIYPDGMAVIWASRLTSRPLSERVTAADFLPDLCKLCAERNFTLYFLGGEEGVAEKAAKSMKDLVPDVNIVGHHKGYFEGEDEEEVIKDINQKKPDILLVGFGVPIQEKWIRQQIETLNIPVLWGVGALFDYFSGKVKRAPLWMRKKGLEWLFRLILEPSRLWKRYLIGNLSFISRAFVLIFTDMILLSLSWLSAYWIRYAMSDFFGKSLNPFSGYLTALPIIVFLWIITYTSFGLYRNRASTEANQTASILKAVILGWLVTSATAFMLKEFDFGRAVVFFASVLNFLLLYISRKISSLILKGTG
ncbi:WecB/TagA/CpsF family glycosyltransferase [bacterium]|nr:WecB/TagA/CpsF family glycosyltransferase [bacterium]